MEFLSPDNELHKTLSLVWVLSRDHVCQKPAGRKVFHPALCQPCLFSFYLSRAAEQQVGVTGGGCVCLCVCVTQITVSGFSLLCWCSSSTQLVSQLCFCFCLLTLWRNSDLPAPFLFIYSVHLLFFINTLATAALAARMCVCVWVLLFDQCWLTLSSFTLSVCPPCFFVTTSLSLFLCIY